MSRVNYVLTSILKKLSEKNGCCYKEIKKEISLSKKQVSPAINFLNKIEAAKIQGKEIKITDFGTEILNLPTEN